jgi:hypothetical protein
MSKVLEDVTKMPASTTLQSMGNVRWLAPEIIIEGESPAAASDTYSFAMTVLELLTETHPLVELKTDIAVVRSSPTQPRRPTAPEVTKWLTDTLWTLMGRCWSTKEMRPTMEDVSKELQAMLFAHHTDAIMT